MTKRASAVYPASGQRAEAGLAKTRAVIAAGALGLAMMLAPAVSAFAVPAAKDLVCHYGGGVYQVQSVGNPATDGGHGNHVKDFFPSDGESAADFTARCEAANPTPSTTTTTTSATTTSTTTTTTSAPVSSTTAPS